ncbi:MAG TPA: RodZ domain-containing protein [Methylomirabilota bacterium]|jgi:cytoskeleton protein RodZ|nr:RodZ domain-containing protein [Methylomirabilota bacterium]
MAEHGVSPPLGGYLRALREERAASLEEMAHATRVSVRQLEALESDGFAELPSPVFVKGFIRAYCHFLGASPDQALARYRDILGEPPSSERANTSTRPAPSWSASPVFISLILLVAFGGGLLALNMAIKRGPKAVVPPIAPAVSVDPSSTSPASAPRVTQPSRQAPAPAVSPTMTPPPSPAASPTAPPPPTALGNVGGQRLHAKAVEETWIRVQTDDGRVVEELLTVGATREWTTAKRFVLTVGNAGGLELVLNGRTLPPLGGRGVVIRGLELPTQTAAPS